MARRIQQLAINENYNIKSTLVTKVVNTCLKTNISPFLWEAGGYQEFTEDI